MHVKCEAAKGEEDTEMSSKQTMKMRDGRQSVLFMALTLAPLRIYNLHLQQFTTIYNHKQMYCYCLLPIFHFPLPFSLVPCRPLPLDSLCFCFELNSVQVRVMRSSEASKVERKEKLPNARYFIPIKSTKESVVGSEIAQQ